MQSAATAMLHTLSQQQFLRIGIPEAWDFFSRPANLGEIMPSDLGFKTVHQPGEKMYEGQIIEYRVMVLPGIWIPWVTEIRTVRGGESFVDEQRIGPFRFWHHLHTFEETEGGVMVKDLVHYALPLWPFGELGHGIFVRPKLERVFGFRKEVLEKRFGGK